MGVVSVSTSSPQVSNSNKVAERDGMNSKIQPCPLGVVSPQNTKLVCALCRRNTWPFGHTSCSRQGKLFMPPVPFDDPQFCLILFHDVTTFFPTALIVLLML